MSAKERRERERAAMKASIMRIATDLIEEDGFEKLTMRKIAERMEYTPMALYNHFPNKDAILRALAEEGFGRFLKANPKRSSLPPVEELRRNLLAYVRYAVTNPEQYRLIFMTRRSGPPAAAPKERQTAELIPEGNGRVAFERLVDRVADCAKQVLIFRNSFSVALYLWTGIHGCASLLITLTNFPFASPKRYAESTVDYLLTGLTATSRDGSTAGKAARKPVARRPEARLKGNRLK